MRTDRTTTLKRVGAAAALVAAVGLAVGLVARCSAPSTITPPVDVTADINAVGAAISAIAAWDPDSAPRFVHLDRTGANPAARIVTAALTSGETVEIAVVPDERGTWAPQGLPQPVPARTPGAVRPLGDRPPSPPTDYWISATEFLTAYLTGDATGVRAWASGDYHPDPLDAPYAWVEIGATAAAVTFPDDRLAFVPIDYSTTSDQGSERSWRSWVAVRESQGRWFVEGLFAVEPLPPAAGPS